MDVLAHVLWTNAAFYKKYKKQKTQRYLAVLFGVLPDIVSFTPATIYLLFHRVAFNPESYQSSSPLWYIRYSFESYNYTHSLVIFVVVFLMVLGLRKGKAYWPLLGWALHIVIDIFTHKDFFPTPFLFPLSNFHNPLAVRWSEEWFMIVNYSAIILVYLLIYLWPKIRKSLA